MTCFSLKMSLIIEPKSQGPEKTLTGKFGLKIVPLTATLAMLSKTGVHVLIYYLRETNSVLKESWSAPPWQWRPCRPVPWMGLAAIAPFLTVMGAQSQKSALYSPDCGGSIDPSTLMAGRASCRTVSSGFWELDTQTSSAGNSTPHMSVKSHCLSLKLSIVFLLYTFF